MGMMNREEVEGGGSFLNLWTTNTISSLPQVEKHKNETTNDHYEVVSKDGKKKRKTNKTDDTPPAWFIDYAKEQKIQFDHLAKLQKEAIEVAKQRNDILKDFSELLAKK
ncbi:uncharacterized protein LOC144349999 [Saccoglossus kowalevskii]